MQKFYIAKLVDKNGDHLASEEVWDEPDSPYPFTPGQAVLLAAGFFSGANEEPEAEGSRILLYGPFEAVTPALVVRVTYEDDLGDYRCHEAERVEGEHAWP